MLEDHWVTDLFPSGFKGWNSTVYRKWDDQTTVLYWKMWHPADGSNIRMRQGEKLCFVFGTRNMGTNWCFNHNLTYFFLSIPSVMVVLLLILQIIYCVILQDIYYDDVMYEIKTENFSFNTIICYTEQQHV